MQSFIRVLRILRDNALACAVFVLAQALVLVWAGQSRSMERQREQLLAQREARELALKLQERIRAYEQVLRGAKALMEANPEVSREQWQTYVHSTLLRQQFPGILGIGFAMRLAPGDVAAHERRIRAQGFPDYRVRPRGVREQYSAIVFMEPFEGRNMRAFGYDMWAEPVRREAMRQAAETGASVLSGRVRLLQAEGVSEAGLLQYVPVYRKLPDGDTPAARVRALSGWVYIPYFVNDLMRDVVGDAVYRVTLYEGEAGAEPIYDSGARDLAASAAVVAVTQRLRLGQRKWTMVLSPTAGAPASSSAPSIILALGTLASLLLAWMVALSGRTRRRAEAVAARDRELLNAVLAASPSPIWVKDESKRLIMVNQAAATLLGARVDEVIGKTAADLHPADVAKQIDAQDDAAFASRSMVSAEGRMFVLNGETRWGIKRKRAVSLPDGRRILIAAVEDLTGYRAVQLELERSREFLTRILDAAGQPIFVKDAAHRWVTVNEAFCRFYGRSREELIGRTDADFRDADFARRAFEQDDQALGRDQPLQWEDRVEGFSAGSQWVLRTKRSFALPDGSRYVVGVNTDITSLKLAERSLRETQERLSVLNQIAGAMARLADLDEVLRTAVSALSRAFPLHRVSFSTVGADALTSVLYSCSCGPMPSLAGASFRLDQAPALLEAMRTRALLEITDIRSDTLYAPLLPLLAEDSVQAALEAPLRVGDVLVGVLCLDAQNCRAWTEHERRTLTEAAEYLCIALERDRARRLQVQAERERSAAHALVDAVVSAIPVVVSVKDEAGRFVLVNDAVRDFHGVEPDIFLGRTDADFFSAEHAVEIAGQDAQARARDDVLTFEECMVSFRGEPRWIVKRKRHVALPDGKRGVVTAMYDVTALKQGEEELRHHRDNLRELVDERTHELSHAKEAAERANRAKSDFLTKMSHELRTPMHAVLSFARLGLDKIAAQRVDAARLKQYFERIDHSGERLLHLLNDLLDVSKLESGYMRYDFSEHDVVVLARGVLNELGMLAQQARVQLALDAPDVTYPLRCDGARLVQVIRNLVSNGIKFTPGGGTVTVQIEEAAALAELGGRSGLMLKVCDTGIGIPAAEADLIFEKFMQSSRTRNNAGGTGLGLTICREIIQAHGGFIRAENAAQGGAVFTVGLPLHASRRMHAASRTTETTLEM